MLKPYKFIISTVVQEVDAEGVVLGEKTGEPITIFGCDKLGEWAAGFESELAKIKGE